jgi:hypothetical protein
MIVVVMPQLSKEYLLKYKLSPTGYGSIEEMLDDLARLGLSAHLPI